VIKSGLLDELEEVRIAVYGFSNNTYRLLAPGRNAGELQKALQRMNEIPSQNTPLEQASLTAIGDSARFNRGGSRILVIFSDGIAEEQYPSLITVARSESVPVYPVVLKPLFPTSRHIPAKTSALLNRQIGAFAALGGETGGEAFTQLKNGGSVLPDLLKRIVEHGRSEYLVGCYATPSDPPRPHHFEVRLRSKEIGVVYQGEKTVSH
jgi:hypothetical protein